MDELRLFIFSPRPLSFSLSPPVAGSRCVRWALIYFALIRAEGQRQHSEWQCGRTAQMLVGKVQLLPPFIAFFCSTAESQSPAHAF